MLKVWGRNIQGPDSWDVLGCIMPFFPWVAKGQHAIYSDGEWAASMHCEHLPPIGLQPVQANTARALANRVLVLAT